MKAPTPISSSLPVYMSVLLHLLSSLCFSSLPSQPPSSSPQLHSGLYCAATAWVSPPEVCSCIRLPEAGRFTPVAQLKNILEENKDMEALFLNTCLFYSVVLWWALEIRSQVLWMKFVIWKPQIVGKGTVKHWCVPRPFTTQIISISVLRPSSVSSGIIKLDQIPFKLPRPTQRANTIGV